MSDFLRESELKGADTKLLLNLMKQYLKEHGEKSLTRVYAQVLANYRRDKFIQQFEVKQSPRDVIPPSVLAGKKSGEMNMYAIGLDHTQLWTKDRKPYSLTSHPYHFRKKELKALIEHCDQHGIDFTIDNHSFYAPGMTLLVHFWKDPAMQTIKKRYATLPLANGGYVVYDTSLCKIVDGVYYAKELALGVARACNGGMEPALGKTPNSVALGLTF